MLKTLAYATLFSTALVGSGALAQQSPGGADNPAADETRPGPARQDADNSRTRAKARPIPKRRRESIS